MAKNFEYDELSQVKINRMVTRIIACENAVRSDVQIECAAKNKALALIDAAYQQVKIAIQFEQTMRLKALKQDERIEG